jgi:TatD DNase family protein
VIWLAFERQAHGFAAMGLIDTHTHLESFAAHGVLPATLARAREAGLEAMITIGTSSEDWATYRDIARANPGFVHYSAGLHPCSVDGGWERELAQLPAFWKGDVRPVALVEIGLDRFHLPKDDAAAAERIFAWQRAAFAAGLALAKELSCPVVVHSRGAFRECVELIDASGVDWAKVVFHCFVDGGPEIAELTSRGGCGSFTGIITYKSAGVVREAAQVQGITRLMLETDAPYLTPVPHRGKPNEPAFLRHTAEYCAEVFGVDYARIAEATTSNARRFFGI